MLINPEILYNSYCTKVSLSQGKPNMKIMYKKLITLTIVFEGF